MKLVIIFGPLAVGKMTVGYELERLTGLRLFHNHMTIDLILHFFAFGQPPFRRLVSEFRNWTTRHWRPMQSLSESPRHSTFQSS